MNIKHLKNLPYQFAFNQHNEIVHISTVKRGLPCNCFCASCGGILVANKGPVRVDYFSHHSMQNRDCAGGLETELHLRAKAIIEKNLSVMFPLSFLHSNHRKILPLDSVEIEVYRDGRKPDLVAHIEGREYFIEIAVTHFSDSNKKAQYREANVSAFEIDMSNLYVETSDDLDREIENALMTDNSDVRSYWLSLNLCSPVGQQVKANEETESLKLLQENKKLNQANDNLELRIDEGERYLASKKQLIDGLKTFEELKREINSKKQQAKVLTENVKHKMDVIINHGSEYSVLHRNVQQQYDQLVKDYDEKVAELKLVRMKTKDANRELVDVQGRLDKESNDIKAIEDRTAELEQIIKQLKFLLEMLDSRGIDETKAAQFAEIIEEVEFLLIEKKETLTSEIDSLEHRRKEVLNQTERELEVQSQKKDKLINEINEFKQQRNKAQKQPFEAARKNKINDNTM